MAERKLATEYYFVFDVRHGTGLRARFFPEALLRSHPSMMDKPFFSVPDACACLRLRFAEKNARGILWQPSFKDLMEYCPRPELISRSTNPAKSMNQIRWVTIEGIGALIPKAEDGLGKSFTAFLMETVLPFVRGERARLADPSYARMLELAMSFLGFNGAGEQKRPGPDRISFSAI